MALLAVSVALGSDCASVSSCGLKAQGGRLSSCAAACLQMGITEKVTFVQMGSSGLSVRSAKIQLAAVVAAPVAALLGIGVWRLAVHSRQAAARDSEQGIAYSAPSESATLAEA